MELYLLPFRDPHNIEEEKELNELTSDYAILKSRGDTQSFKLAEQEVAGWSENWAAAHVFSVLVHLKLASAWETFSPWVMCQSKTPTLCGCSKSLAS